MHDFKQRNKGKGAFEDATFPEEEIDKIFENKEYTMKELNYISKFLLLASPTIFHDPQMQLRWRNEIENRNEQRTTINITQDDSLLSF